MILNSPKANNVVFKDSMAELVVSMKFRATVSPCIVVVGLGSVEIGMDK